MAAHPDNAQPGETVTFTGSGFGANTTVVVEMHPQTIVLGSTTVARGSQSTCAPFALTPPHGRV